MRGRGLLRLLRRRRLLLSRRLRRLCGLLGRRLLLLLFLRHLALPTTWLRWLLRDHRIRVTTRPASGSHPISTDGRMTGVGGTGLCGGRQRRSEGCPSACPRRAARASGTQVSCRHRRSRGSSIAGSEVAAPDPSNAMPWRSMKGAIWEGSGSLSIVPRSTAIRERARLPDRVEVVVRRDHQRGHRFVTGPGEDLRVGLTVTVDVHLDALQCVLVKPAPPARDVGAQ